jgi:aminoglycoside phosphotransferase family enzyme/predicted kinase
MRYESRSADLLREALRGAGASWVEHETHCSLVLVTADRAYKLKKPVAFGFIDQRTPEARRDGCAAEVSLNRILAPHIVRGVRGLLASPAGAALGAADDPFAVDWVVEMARYDEHRTLAVLAAEDALLPGDLGTVARRIATFHRHAPRVECDEHPILKAFPENLAELRAVALEWDPVRRLRDFQPFFDAFKRSHAAQLDHRARRGWVRDVHGDLRADHVLVEGAMVTVVDRIEFDAGLRHIDVADDLAFLLMDLEARGAKPAADALLAEYRRAGGHTGPLTLLAFFETYRALVRAKVELLRASQLKPASFSRALAHARARDFLALAERLAWRARDPVTMLVIGPPGSGKTTLATALADRAGVPYMSSDRLRFEVCERGDYSPGARGAVYTALGQWAACQRSCIVDATFSSRRMRELFLEAFDGAGVPHQIRVVECRVAPGVAQTRAQRRWRTGVDASEADGAMAQRLSALTTPFAEIPEPRRLELETIEEPDELVDAVEGWLDRTSARMPAPTVQLEKPRAVRSELGTA